MMYKFCVAFICVFMINSVSAKDFTVSEHCVGNNSSFELSELKFSFDFKHVSKINILNGEAASSVVSFKNTWLPELHVITTSEDSVSGGINTRGGYQTLGISNIQGLFNKIKYDTSKDMYFLNVKSAMGLTNPNDIQIINHADYSINIMNDVFDKKDAVYIIRKDDPRIIMLVAEFTEFQLHKLLGHICL